MFGQLPDFTNGFEFLRKLWASGSGMPSGLMPGLGSMAPPMNLDDIDKRIHDLKAVESWLQLNTNLLRTTIQGLEVQRATLVALQTFGNALSPEAMQNAMENVARAANAPSATPPHPPHPPHHYGTGETVSEAQADRENDEPDDEGIEAPPDAGASAEAEASAASAASAGPAPVPPNASLWWDLLQQQFSQIANSAAAAASVAPFSNLGSFGAQPAPGNATEPAPEPAPKPDKAAAGAGNGKARPAAKKTAAKPATKPAATKPAARKPAVRKAPAGKTAAGGKSAKPAKPDAPPAPGTPEDTSE